MQDIFLTAFTFPYPQFSELINYSSSKGWDLSSNSKTLMVGSNIASLLSIAETIETIERK